MPASFAQVFTQGGRPRLNSAQANVKTFFDYPAIAKRLNDMVSAG